MNLPARLLPAHEIAALRQARTLVEGAPLGVRLVAMIGDQVAGGLDRLPGPVRRRVDAVAQGALNYALKAAVRTLAPGATGRTPGLNRAASAVTGFAGGFGGVATTVAELPLTTMLIVRAIAQEARAHGENIRDPECQRACLEVFALGGRGPEDDAADTGYWATRVAFADAAGPALVQALAVAARHLGLAFGQKVAAQAAPLIGAAVAAGVNVMFTAWYQDLARGHFAIRRLERQYGYDAVRGAWRLATPQQR